MELRQFRLVPCLVALAASVLSTIPLFAQSFNAVEPSQVAVDGSTRVRLLGSGFTSRTTATVGGKDVVELSFVDSRTLEGFAPALGPRELPGRRDAAVEIPQRVGVLRLVLEDAVTYVTGPTLASFTPPEVSLLGKTTFEIRGTGLATATRVLLSDDTPLSIRRVTATTIQGGIPPHAPTLRPLGVTVASPDFGEVRLADAVSFIGPLQLTSVDPSNLTRQPGVAVEVTFEGVGFTPESRLELVGPLPLDSRIPLDGARWRNAREMVAPVSDLAAGTYDARVVDTDAGVEVAHSLAAALVVQTGPRPIAVHEVVPREIPRAGGVDVVIRGEGLGAETAVYFGELRVEIRSVDAGGGEVHAFVPDRGADASTGARNVYAVDPVRDSASVLQSGIVYVGSEPGDADADGIPESEDLCPDTPAGIAVNRQGCADFEVLRKPEILVAPLVLQLTELLPRVEGDELVTHITPLLLEALDAAEATAILLREGDFDAAAEFQDLLDETLERANKTLADDVATILDEVESLSLHPPGVLNGDADEDGQRDLADVLRLLEWLFLDGPAPSTPKCPDGIPLAENGDLNGDSGRDVGDVLYFLFWQFTGGRPPVPMCELGPFADARELDSLAVALRVKQAELDDIVAMTRQASSTLRGAAERIRKNTRNFRGRVARLDDAAGWLELESGEVLGLLPGQTYEEVSEGSVVDITASSADGRSGLIQEVAVIEDRVIGAFPDAAALLSQCIHLRVVPVQKLAGVVGTSQLVRHHPTAYEHGDGTLWLERGMRLAAYLDFNCFVNLPYLDAQQYYSPSLKIELEYWPRFGAISPLKGRDKLIATSSVKVTLAEDLKSNDIPVALPTNIHPNTVATLTVTHRQRICDVPIIDFIEPSCTEWGEPTVVTYPVLVKPTGHYAEATYDNTTFNLEDSPVDASFATTRVTSVELTDIESDLASPATFVAEGYSVTQGTSSRPAVVPISQNQDFAVMNRDFDFFTPYSSSLLFLPYLDPNSGVLQPAGLRWPRVEGQHNGRAFRYSCLLPRVIHDRLSICLGTSTFYRMPFREGTEGLTMGQANNGGFTHQGNQFFAYDFGFPEGTEILAARGGVVQLLCDVNTLNCFDSSTNPANCSACTSDPIPNSLCVSNTNSGNYLMIRHEDGTYTWYAHIQSGGFFVSEGQRVRRGDPLANSGNVGCSSAAHLHWQVNSCPVTNCGHSTMASRFQALDALDGDVFNCYNPLEGDDLYSNNHPWNDPP